MQSRSGDDSRLVSSLKQEIANLRRENEELKSSGGKSSQTNLDRPGSSDKRLLAQLETQSSDTSKKLRVVQVRFSQPSLLYLIETSALSYQGSQEQNYKLQEYTRLLESRATQSDELAKQYMNRSASLEKRCRELEKRRGTDFTPEKEQSIQAELKTIQNENEALKQHHAAALASRDEEIQHLRESLEAVESRLEEIRSDGGSDSETVDQLRQDNEILRQEVSNLKQRLKKGR